MVPIITPKHIANDLGVEVSEVRALLRAKYGLAPTNRWLWDLKEAKKIKTWLAKTLGKKVGSL
jgi:hypothetical protein